MRDELLSDFSKEALIKAIERPTSEQPLVAGQPSPYEQYRFRFEPNLVEHIAKDVLNERTTHQDSVLPLAQLICAQLFELVDERRPAVDHIEIILMQDYEEGLGGVQGGLKAFAERAIEQLMKLGQDDLIAFKRLMTHLYIPLPDGTLSSWPRLKADLEGYWTAPTPFEHALESGIGAGLLRIDQIRIEGTLPRPYVRLGHDALTKVVASWQTEQEKWDREKQEQERLRLREQQEQERYG